MIKSISLVFGLGLGAAASCLANITVGLPANGFGDCYPFGCAYQGEYQQVYTHSAFGGPATITGLEFFNTSLNSNTPSLNTGTFTISLSTTAASPSTLSSTFAANLGANNTQVFSGSLAQPWAFGDILKIQFATPFLYTPAAGNLLLDVNVSGASAPAGNVYFDFTSSNALISRTYHPFGQGTQPPVVDVGKGLITDFLTTSTTSTPEPGGLSAVMLALGGVIVLLRKRLRA